MTPQDERNERFDVLFNSLGYDNIDTCTCEFLQKCQCISGRDRMKIFLQSEVEKAVEEKQEEIIWLIEDLRGFPADVISHVQAEVIINEIKKDN